MNKEGNLQLHWVISILMTGVMWVKVAAKTFFDKHDYGQNLK